jgi:hypothetical protein
MARIFTITVAALTTGATLAAGAYITVGYPQLTLTEPFCGG